jgi:short subunit dehydrogenase-like uncharacterized protein
MQNNSFLLYGANGYTGELIARYASQYNLQPILAGRSESSLAALAAKLKLSYKVFDLNNTDALVAALKEVKVVVHAAGPFHFTAKQMIDACLQTGTHYLDINGDISVFEMLKKYDAKAKTANIMVMPGVGFDVVPTDCIALLLKKSLPDATSLKLAFGSLGGGVSHGTAMTMASKIGEGGANREDGKIVRKPLGQKGMWVDFFRGTAKEPKSLFVMSIPWGDVSTAHFTTGIPNIETYTGISKRTYKILKFQSLFNWLLRTNFIRNYLKKKIKQKPAGPSDEQRSKALSLVWGQVANANGKIVTAKLCGPEGYTLTALSTLIITQKVLTGNIKPGYQTPAGLYGEDLVLEIQGVEREKIIIE